VRVVAQTTVAAAFLVAIKAGRYAQAVAAVAAVVVVAAAAAAVVVAVVVAAVMALTPTPNLPTGCNTRHTLLPLSYLLAFLRLPSVFVCSIIPKLPLAATTLRDSW